MNNIISLTDYCREAFDGLKPVSTKGLIHAADILNKIPEPCTKEIELYAKWMGVELEEPNHGT